MSKPYYTIEQNTNADGSLGDYRLVVYDDYDDTADVCQLLDVVEAPERETLQDYVRDTHPDAKSLETLSEERA